VDAAQRYCGLDQVGIAACSRWTARFKGGSEGVPGEDRVVDTGDVVIEDAEEVVMDTKGRRPGH
jgi:hypothetical protein